MKIAFYMLCVLMLAGCADGEKQERYELNTWRLKVGDNLEWTDPAFDDSAWDQLSLPASFKPGKSLTVFWMRTEWTIPAANQNLWFLSSILGTAMDVYINGQYVGSRGQIDPDFNVSRQYAAAFLLPSTINTPGTKLTIALRCANRATKISIPMYSIGNKAARNFDINVVNFWNGRFSGIIASLCFFLGLFCLSLFLFQRTDKDNLLLAIIMLFFAPYLYYRGVSVWPFKWKWTTGLSLALMISSLLFLPSFLTSFFNVFKNRFLIPAAATLSCVVAILLIATAGDETIMNAIFNSACIFVFIAILGSSYIIIHALRKGENIYAAVPILIGIIIGIGCASHDLYFLMRGSVPVLWFQGIGLSLLNISIFFAMSFRQARLKTESDQYAREIEINARHLRESFTKIQDAAAVITGLGQELDHASGHAAAAVQESVESGLAIGKESELQVQESEKADQLINDFVNSIRHINENIERQIEEISRIAEACAQLSAGTEVITTNIERTLSFTKNLETMTESGKKAAFALDSTMQRISESSDSISGVISLVENFAEQTSLLSMNAAIEAAHAGSAGRGFAIIATEIKKLSESQKQQVGHIRAIIIDMVEKIQEGTDHTAHVYSALMEITSGAKSTAEQIDEVNTESHDQTHSTSSIHEAMANLAGSSTNIKDELKKQMIYSEKVRKTVQAIAAESESVRKSTTGIIEDNKILSESIRGLSNLAARSRIMTEKLAEGSNA
ncbi:hypothetical protein FACS1894172_04140 [Spirochaetia bacterium]|nr:hypothetical protein FACS1894172_04140 [Spirochaetia bacterium]